MTNIQGIFSIDKQNRYLVRIGSLLFPFQNANEVFEYLKRRVKHG
jgi:hypothetical protein